MWDCSKNHCFSETTNHQVNPITKFSQSEGKTWGSQTLLQHFRAVSSQYVFKRMESMIVPNFEEYRRARQPCRTPGQDPKV